MWDPYQIEQPQYHCCIQLQKMYKTNALTVNVDIYVDIYVLILTEITNYCPYINFSDLDYLGMYACHHVYSHCNTVHENNQNVSCFKSLRWIG